MFRLPNAPVVTNRHVTRANRLHAAGYAAFAAAVGTVIGPSMDPTDIANNFANTVNHPDLSLVAGAAIGGLGLASLKKGRRILRDAFGHDANNAFSKIGGVANDAAISSFHSAMSGGLATIGVAGVATGRPLQGFIGLALAGLTNRMSADSGTLVPSVVNPPATAIPPRTLEI